MKKKLLLLATTFTFFLSQSMTVFAVTEAEVEAVGKGSATGNVFIWFLCAIAFLKISQKIDSFLNSLGINVGNTGGSMLSELMVAAKGLTFAKTLGSNTFLKGGSFHTGRNSSNASFMNSGLAGAVGRQFTQNAMSAITGQANNPIGRMAFESSLKKGGEFANSITGAVAQGSINYTGSMTGPQAAQALSSYLGHTGISDAPSFSNVEIGGGRIMGTEISIAYPNGTSFGMYHADQYMAPEGNYETITAADNTTWYKQYATDTVERIPYMTSEGQIAYHESIVQKLPDMPKRKDRI